MTSRVAFAQWPANQVTSPSINMEGHLLDYGGTAFCPFSFLMVPVTQLFNHLHTHFLPCLDIHCCLETLDPWKLNRNADASHYIVLLSCAYGQKHAYVAPQLYCYVFMKIRLIWPLIMKHRTVLVIFFTCVVIKLHCTAQAFISLFFHLLFG